MSGKQMLKGWGLSALLLTAMATVSCAAPDKQSREELVRVKAVLEQSIKTDPNNSSLWMHLGFTDRDLDDLDGSQAAFEKTRELNPKNADALYMLALIYEKKKMPAEAVKCWKSLEEIAPEKREVAEKHIHHLNAQ